MRRRILPAAILLAGLAALRCGGSSAPVQPTPMAVGGACVQDLRAEFARQQSLVYWPIYCPSELPDGFHLATADDAKNATSLGGGAAPTQDDLNPGGGTFITRMTTADGRQLVFVQGAGASIYERRDESVRPGGFESPLRSVLFGDLSGDLFSKEPAAVIAFDALGYGHMIVAAGLDPDSIAKIASGMRRVDPSALRVSLLSLAQLHEAGGDWVVSWAANPTGEHVSNPEVCQRQVDPGLRSAEVTVTFDAAPSGTAPDAGGHGPFLQQAMIRFTDEDAALAYVDAVAGVMQSCPLTWTGADSLADVTYTFTAEASPGLGDQSLAFRRSVRSPVQAGDTSVEVIRLGEFVGILIYSQTVSVDGNPSKVDLSPYALMVTERLEHLYAGAAPPNPGAAPSP